MSASGTGPIENDFALDLCDGLRGLDAEQVIVALRAAMRAAVDTTDGEYLGRDVGEPAIAAAAIAIAGARQRLDLLEEVELGSTVPAIPTDLLPLAIAAIERTVRADSETRRLWEQAGAETEWMRTLESLVAAAQAP